MRIFGSIEPLNECLLPFLYSIILQPYQSFELPSSTPGGDRQMRSRTFLEEIQFRTTFIVSFYHVMRIFGRVVDYLKIYVWATYRIRANVFVYCFRCDVKTCILLLLPY